MSFQQKQLDDEQDKIRAEKANRLEALRKRLADETQQAILEQEKQMGALIGRLQAGAARRQAIIKKNEEQLAKLEVSASQLRISRNQYMTNLVSKKEPIIYWFSIICKARLKRSFGSLTRLSKPTLSQSYLLTTLNNYLCVVLVKSY